MQAIERDFFSVKRGDVLAENKAEIRGLALFPGERVEVDTAKGTVTLGINEPIMIAPECDCGAENCEWC